MNNESSSDTDRTLGLILGTLVAMPLVLAWVWAPRLTSRQRVWQRRAPNRVAVTLVLLGSAAVTVLIGRWALIALLGVQLTTVDDCLGLGLLL